MPTYLRLSALGVVALATTRRNHKLEYLDWQNPTRFMSIETSLQNAILFTSTIENTSICPFIEGHEERGRK